MKRVSKEDLEALRNSGLFDEKYYLEQYPDVKMLGMDPLEHYLWVGEKLGRELSPQLKAVGNLNQNSDMAEINGDRLSDCQKKGNNSHPYTVLPIPMRQKMDGKRLLTQSRNREHFWYKNHVSDDFLNQCHKVTPLPSHIRRILVIAHDFKLLTGCSRSLSHYLNAMTLRGGHEFTSIELAPGAHAEAARNHAETHDFVIINSISPLFTHEGMIELAQALGPKKVAIYLHETQWIFEKLQREQPERFQKFIEALPSLNLLCVSQMQRDWLRVEYGVKNSALIHEVTTLIETVPETAFSARLDPRAPLSIVMAGTLQPRKGTSLFSKVADLAHEAGLPWKFSWAGKQVCKDEEIYKSSRVAWLGNLDNAAMSKFVLGADVFFLSSEDDPFPLCVLEALQAQKRAVVYQKTGVSELLAEKNAPGIVFDAYTPQAAFAAIKEVVNLPCSHESFSAINQNLSLAAFTSRLHEAIRQFSGEGKARRASTTAKIAVVAHLYYHDLWSEMASYLRNLSHLDCDLYITLCRDHDSSALADVRGKIMKAFPGAVLLECPNRGMDIGPFVAVINHIFGAGKRYDYLVKIHSKKSLEASGAEAGAQWRQDLYEGLLGTPTKIDQILNLFIDRPEIGMIGPRGMLLEKSSKDQTAGKNLNGRKMATLGQRMQVQDSSLHFFRGSMFWCRFKPIFDAVTRGGLSVEDFEPGHAPDMSNAHAMERLFACIIRDSGQKLYECDATMPKTVRFLKNRHEGEDIYIIAAGASCDYIDPAFFEGKTTIGINKVYKRFQCDYTLMKEYLGAANEQDMLAPGTVPVIAKWHSGNIREGLMQLNKVFITNPAYYYFDHVENKRDKVDLSIIGAPENRTNDKLVVSYSTITTAMHLAAYMGARNIILVGHDCGLLNGKSTFDGYYPTDIKTDSPWQHAREYEAWLDQIEAQTLVVRDRMREVYGCNIVSLNPFVNFGLEGNVYQRGA